MNHVHWENGVMLNLTIKMRKVIVIGGGTAGWLTALFVKKNWEDCDVSLIASSKMGILGAGEGTTKNFFYILNSLGIDLDDFREKTGSTKKQGINFINWRGDGTSFKHTFQTDNETYALHFDARLVAAYLQSLAESRGIKYIDGIVSDFVETKTDIICVILSDNTKVKCDFIFDCSGFQRLVIGKHFKTNWKSYDEHLVCNSAFAFFLPQLDEDIQSKDTWTSGISMKNGWIWEAPLKHRWGCGYVYSDKYASAEEVLEEAEEYYGRKLDVVKHFKFNTGTYEKFWIKNCVAIGLSSSFLEPMEATSLMTIIMSLKVLKSLEFDRNNTLVYNKRMLNYNEQNMFFVRHHYICDRDDTKFWIDYKQRDLPNPLCNLYDESGQYLYLTDNELKEKLEVFGGNLTTYNAASWKTVYDGKNTLKSNINKLI